MHIIEDMFINAQSGGGANTCTKPPFLYATVNASKKRRGSMFGCIYIVRERRGSMFGCIYIVRERSG